MTPQAVHVPAEAQEIGPAQSRASAPLRISQAVYVIAICLILAVGVWLRWSGLNAQSMWADEGFSAWFSQFSPGTQWHLLSWDTQGPTYHIVLHYWVALWGTSEASFRSLSALFSTLSLAVFYLIAQKIWPDRLFVSLSLMLYSFSFFQIWYAKESRTYALLAFLLLTCVYCMLMCLSKPTVLRVVGLAVALAVALYTHNMALYYLPGLIAFWFVYPSNMTFGARLKKVALVGSIVLFLYLPWLPTLIRQVVSVHGYYWAPKPSIKDLFGTLDIFSGIDIYVLQGLRQHLPIRRGFGLRTWLLIPIVILALSIAGTWWGTRSIDRRKSLALQLATLVPILGVFLWSQVSRSVYVNRNLIGVCALVPLVLCAPLAVQFGNKRRAFEAIVLAVLIGTVTSLALHQERKDDWRGVTEYVLKIPERQRLVVVLQPYCQILVNYYSTGLFKSDPKPDITGLITQFDAVPQGPGLLPDLNAADPSAILSQAIDSREYKEIDIALQLERLPPKVQAIPEFLKTHCSSVENAEFGKIGVFKCFLQPN